MSKPELLDQLKVLLGGFVAEELVFERTTTGAAGDLQRVIKISRAMIEDYGMGSQIFLASGSGSEALTSQATLHRRDEEQQGLVDEAMFEARMLIMDNRATLDRLAEALLSKETLDRAEIEAIMRPDDSAPELPEAEEPAAEIEEIIEAVEPVEPTSNGSVAPPLPRPSVAPPDERLHSQRAARTGPAIAARRMVGTDHLDCLAMFEAVDHVGVAVEDLDTAIELYTQGLGMPLQHRETVSEQGVEAALLGVGDSHVELLRPLGEDTPVGRFLAKRGPGLHHTAYRCAGRRRGARAVPRTRAAPDRRAAAARDPRQPGRVPPSGLDRRGADRAGSARRGGRALMARDDDELRRVEVGFAGGQAITLRLPQRAYESFRKDVQRGGGWTEVESADGLVSLNLDAVVFMKLDTGDHRVGFSGL